MYSLNELALHAKPTSELRDFIVS